ncbi:MAG: Do family serine endopeptidase [Planctomycetota bacterium]
MSLLKSNVWNRRPFQAVVVPVMCGLVFAASLASIGAIMPSASKNPAAGPARALSQGFREAVKAVQPAVVMIKSEAAMPVKLQGQTPGDDDSFERQFGEPFGNMPELRKFFKNMPRTPHHGQGGLGSGLIVDVSGVILTNAHVVRDGREITVRLHDGREYKANKVHIDPKADLAVLRIEGADNLTAAKLGNSDEAEVGDWVLALGNPFGLEGTVTAGIISAKGRGIGLNERESFIQTDAAINPGNSGGPLVNLDGEVIGINTAISSSSGGNEGVGFAIPINLAKWVAKQLTDGDAVHRARLGVMIQPLTHDLAQQFGVKTHEGVLVAGVSPDSPAAKVGFKAGDVIVEFAGKAVASPQELQGLVEQSAIGKEQSVVVLREGKRLELKISPTEMAGDAVATGDNAVRGATLEKLGIEAQNLTHDLAAKLQIKAEQGVVVTDVQAGSVAERAGLTSGAVIVEANRAPIKNVEDLSRALDEKSLAKGVLLLVRTTQGSRFLVIRS